MTTKRAAAVLVAALLAVLVWVNTDYGGTGSGNDSQTLSTPRGPASATGSVDAPTPVGVTTPADEADDEPAPGDVDPQTGLVWVAESELPSEALATLKAIDDNGPYPYDGDGVVFENREGFLPSHETGYYHEFTVETPGSDDRGARRIVTGSASEFFYTDDHYESFKRIAR